MWPCSLPSLQHLCVIGSQSTCHYLVLLSLRFNALQDFKKIAERMSTRTTQECAMIYGDQKHSAWFQPYNRYNTGKCKCSDEMKARGGCRHKSQRAKLHGSAKGPDKQAQPQVRVSSDKLPKLAHSFLCVVFASASSVSL